MLKNKKIYIAGHSGMVGSAVWRLLNKDGYTYLLGKSSRELDLRDQSRVLKFFEDEKPDIVIDAAARVGGILANRDHPYPFLMDNLMIQNNLIQIALTTGVKKFIFLGSSCIYPKMAPQPLKEEYLLTGPLEPTNQWYAIAKIAGVKAIEAIRLQYGIPYISLMPTNLYGPYDNFDLQSSHVLPAMIRKFHEAKIHDHAPVNLWGTGSPMREFLHVEDLARAIQFTLENDQQEHLLNVGTGTDISIKDLAAMIQRIVGHEGDIIWDSSKPDGTPRKLLDVSKLNKAGWQAQITPEEGIRSTYQWFLENQDDFKQIKLNQNQN